MSNAKNAKFTKERAHPEAALTAKPPAERKNNDVRMYTMTEGEVMSRSRDAVSKYDPNMSYSKQKKIRQGASGSVHCEVRRIQPWGTTN